MQCSENPYPEDDLLKTAPAPATSIGLSKFKDDDLLTKHEIAQALGCAPRTLQRMVERFEIPPATRLGGCCVWIAGNVKAWIKEAAAKREAAAAKEAKRLDAQSR